MNKAKKLSRKMDQMNDPVFRVYKVYADNAGNGMILYKLSDTENVYLSHRGVQFLNANEDKMPSDFTEVTNKSVILALITDHNLTMQRSRIQLSNKGYQVVMLAYAGDDTDEVKADEEVKSE